MPAPWDRIEIEAIVKDYFDMLLCQIRGEPYNKTEHRRNLLPLLNGRSEGSIEMKHQNISAVLIDNKLPYITGYKPAKNYQGGLFPEIVLEYFSATQDVFDSIRADADTTPSPTHPDNILSALSPAPDPRPKKDNAIKEPREPYYRAPIAYLAWESANASLGAAGEAFVLEFEHARLVLAGKDKLADRIEQVSSTQGDFAGYDILSFDADGRERLIEVKTTKGGAYTPFYISANEVSFSESNSENYFLYRVYEFRENPKLFTLKGDIKHHAQLEPQNYRAYV